MANLLGMNPQPDFLSALSMASGAQPAVSPFGMLSESDLPVLNKPVKKGTQSKSEVKTNEQDKRAVTKDIRDPAEFEKFAESYRQTPEFQAQQQGAKELEDAINMKMGKGAEGNSAWVKPLLALADSETGSNLMAGYTPPAPQDKLLALKEKLQDNKGNVLKELSSAFKAAKTGSETDSTLKQLQQMMMYGQGMNNTGALADVRGKRLISDAGAAFDKDPLLKDMEKTHNSLDRAMGMINGKTPITAKNFAILQQDMINAMAPGGAATEGKVNREMVTTLSTMLNDIGQRFGSVSDLRKEDPGLFKQLGGLIGQIQGDYNKAYENRVGDIKSNYKYVADPDLQATVNEKVDRLLKRRAEPAVKTAPAKTAAKDPAQMTNDELKEFIKSHGG